MAPLGLPDGHQLPRQVEPTSDHIRGDREAEVTMVLYAAMNDTYRQGPAESIRDASSSGVDSGRVRLVYRHHVTTAEEMAPALALEAAAQQGRFWDLHDALVASPGEIGRSASLHAAQDLNLDVSALCARMEQGADEARVNDHSLDPVGITDEEPGPALYLNGERISATQNSWHLARQLRDLDPRAE